MIIGHSRPILPSWSVSGTGAAILSSTTQLADGHPKTKTKFRWLSGTQSSLTSILRLRMEWGTPLVPRLTALLGTTLPVGLYTTTRWRRASDPFGTFPYAPTSLNDNQRIKAGPRNERRRWELLAPGADACVGVEYAFLNNVSGSVAISASAEFFINEIGVFAADEVDIDRAWTLETIDPTVKEYEAVQNADNYGYPYRRLKCKFPLEPLDDVFGTASDNREALLAKIDRGQVCAYVPRYRIDGVFDENLFHRTAIMGAATELPDFSHNSGDYFTSTQMTVVENAIPT